jgi:hypothetical protein
MMSFSLIAFGVIIFLLLLLAVVIGGAVAAVVQLSRRIASLEGSSSAQERVHCPFCAELILPEAKICRYCERELSGLVSSVKD